MGGWVGDLIKKTDNCKPEVMHSTVGGGGGMWGIFENLSKKGFGDTQVCMMNWRYGGEFSLFWMVHVQLAAFQPAAGQAPDAGISTNILSFCQLEVRSSVSDLLHWMCRSHEWPPSTKRYTGSHGIQPKNVAQIDSICAHLLQGGGRFQTEWALNPCLLCHWLHLWQQCFK